MKRVLLGVLLFLGLSTAFTPTAGAAEIPPTQECTTLLKIESVEFEKKIYNGVSDRAEERFEREMVEALKAADCISAVNPVIHDLPAKDPSSSECLASVAAARAFWTPATETYLALDREFRKVDRPFKREIARHRAQIRRLKRRGGQQSKIRVIRAQMKLETRRHKKAVRPLNREFRQFIARRAFADTLVIYELLAQRCLGVDAFEDFFVETGPRLHYPAAVLVRKNFALLFTSSVFAWKMANDQAAEDLGKARSSSLRGPGTRSFGDGRHLPGPFGP